jgi:hypothetical protein
MTMSNDSETEIKANGDGGPNGHTKPVARSEEAYPYHSLQEALRVPEAVQKAGGNVASVSEVMKVMGLTSMAARSWTYRLSTARVFGLVDKGGRGDDAKIQVTDLFVAYANPTSDAERRATLMQIVLKPALYGKLLARYKGAPKPDVIGLANLLWRDHGILPTVKEQAAEAFLASIEFAGLVTNGLVSMTASASAPVSIPLIGSGASAEDKDAKPPAEMPPVKSGMQNVEVPADFIVYPCKIGKGRIIKIPLPPEFTRSEVERLYAFLLTQIDDDVTT